MKFNLNADMAEGYGPWKMGDDDALLDIIATANIACGFHAGDHNIMGRVMAEARDKKVSIGSHPGFLDLHGFGRRQMKLPFAEIERLMAYQIGASLGMASLVGADVSHVKVHGALSDMACADDELSDALVKAVHAVAPDLILLAPALSPLSKAGYRYGLSVGEEIFADRTYMPDGQLTPRSRPDAMIEDKEAALAQCLGIFETGKVKTVEGTIIDLPAHSICVHGDGPTAIDMARHVRKGMEEAGYQLVTLPEMLA